MSRNDKVRPGQLAASAAGAVLRFADTRKTYTGARKDASHGAFYAGAAKGFGSALEGLLLFLARPELRARLRDSLTLIFGAHIPHAIVAAGVILFLRYRADDLGQLLWTFSRWARIITVAMTYLLDRQHKATEAMFFDALAAKNPAFAAAVRAQPPIKKTMLEKFDRYKRIAKMMSFRAAGTVVAYIIPGGRFIVIPIIKYISMRPTLGGEVAAVVAAIHALPDSILQRSHIHDFLMAFSEAVLDAAELGHDSVTWYIKRLDGDEMREYFRERYRGYMSGMGFFYSVLMQVPFLGIPLVLIAECGAAVMVIDIVTRNLEKEERLSLPGEAVILQQTSAPAATSKLD
jgi:hypothetical protein